MNPTSPQNAAAGHRASTSLSVDDALFTLFRHKWLVLAFVFLGLLGAVIVRFVRPPLYVSKAKFMVHYVVDSRAATTANSEGQNVQPVDVGAHNIINSEIEILTSLDVAKEAVTAVGPEKILAKKGGGSDPLGAAGVVCSGIEVAPPKASIIAVSFKHPDADIVQPVLNAVIHSYMLKHLEVHVGGGELEDYYIKEKDELRKKLATTELELKRLKTDANVLFLEDTKRAYASQIVKAQEELMDAQRELAERQAVLGNLGTGLGTPGATNNAETTVSAEKLSEYGEITTQLAALKKHERELLLVYKDAYPLVQTVRGQMAALVQQKTDLEQAFPALKQVVFGGGREATNAPGGDPSAQLVEVKRLRARVGVLGTILTDVQAEAARVLDKEPQIVELERLRTELQKSYDLVGANLERTKKGGSMVAGNVINMSVVDHPTPPTLDYKKMFKLLGVVLAGCIGMGLGLAFLMDHFFDRSIKRSSDIERHLRLPVFLSIPDTSWGGGWLRLPGWLGGQPHTKDGSLASAARNGGNHGQTALVPWSPGSQLLTYTEGLRERIMSYFEVHNLNLKKPKLVAVTGCDSGAGVSTLASGLAAALSKTGDGNVLLVDMNVDHEVAHSFYKGKPGCGIAAVLEPEGRAEAQVQDNLYLATLNSAGDDKVAKVLPARLNHLMPQLKASDYDYIIFDMPPVTQTSATPRLASYMDLALLVIESEKTRQHTAVRASALMRDARANVAAVLNKRRSHMPPGLSQEA